ncbi:hypothetical protein WG926_03605 [Tistrella sp. BH-R2-4]|uniref:ATP synthase subunit b n=1 Tax=Tistrella arctica TaxID=3133430 RepID=A0ABU9YF11_9PROT
MHIDWWTIAIQAVNVLILIWLLRRFLFRPVAGIIEQRRLAVVAEMDAAAAARSQADALAARAREDHDRQQANRAAATALATADATRAAAAVIAKAHADADAIMARAADDAARLAQAGAADTARGAQDLAVRIAGRLLDRLPPAARIDGFIDGFASALAALPADLRARLAAGPVDVVAAVAPDGETSARLETAVLAALGRATTDTTAPLDAKVSGDAAAKVRVAVDPALIAGLELVADHAVVRNSFRADLARITEELARP